MQTLFYFLIRLVLLAAASVFAASLALIAAVLMALWGARALWCKLTGQPINPFAVRMSPRTGFGNVFRTPAGRPAPAGSPPSKRKSTSLDDVTDVEAKEVR
jgi:hypothetical protein